MRANTHSHFGWCDRNRSIRLCWWLWIDFFRWRGRTIERTHTRISIQESEIKRNHKTKHQIFSQQQQQRKPSHEHQRSATTKRPIFISIGLHKAMATLGIGLSKVFILDKYFNELSKYWETEIKLQGTLRLYSNSNFCSFKDFAVWYQSMHTIQ